MVGGGAAVEVAGAVAVEGGDGAAGDEAAGDEEGRGRAAAPFERGDGEAVEAVGRGRWSGSGSSTLSQPDGEGSAHVSSV